MSKQQKDTYSTIKIPVEYCSTEDSMLISAMRRQQTHIIRSAFKKYEKGLSVKDNSFDGYNDIDGCLYCGDADFFHCDTLDCLKKRLSGRENNVGMLQLPHHGSKENFNIELLNWLGNLMVSFACYGNPNRYNHPSSDVMGTAGTYSHVIGVNQFKSNVLTERIDVGRK